LYPEYLARIERLSQMRVPLRTRVALQASNEVLDAATVSRLAPGLRSANFSLVDEDSIDPRDLCAALPVAVHSMGVEVLEECGFLGVRRNGNHAEVATVAGELESRFFVDCRGVASEGGMEPRKGQMVAVEWPAERLRCVVRTAEVYLVPRGDGRVVIGATVERGVSDTIVHAEEIEGLVAPADDLLPGIASAPRLESWAGVRPGTADDMPVMGATAERNCFVASGHFRNGILLAPATARVMTQLICGDAPSVALDAFSLARFHPLSR
jgi:glycine oxidase